MAVLMCAPLCTMQFDPDEWWQCTEVAHRLVYGYGELTWEWVYGLRSYVHVLPFAVLFQARHTTPTLGSRTLPQLGTPTELQAFPTQLLRLASCDSPTVLVHAPRVLQGVVAAAGDLCIGRFASVYFDDAAVGQDVLLLSVIEPLSRPYAWKFRISHGRPLAAPAGQQLV